jgi:hypothetical protein
MVPGNAAPIVGEAGLGRVGDDGAAPVVVGQDRPGDPEALVSVRIGEGIKIQVVPGG